MSVEGTLLPAVVRLSRMSETPFPLLNEHVALPHVDGSAVVR